MKEGGYCPRCGSLIIMPDELHDAARRSPDIPFYCSYGHHLHYPEAVKPSKVVPFKVIKNDKQAQDKDQEA